VSSPELFQRIVDGDEIALRDAFRRYGAIARDLARRVVGPQQADEIVEEAFLLIWCEPEHWASPALDVHILRIVRDLSLAVRRRGVAVEIAVRDLQPFPIAPDLSLPDVVNELKQDELQRALLRLPNYQGRRLEDAWLDGLRHDDEPLNRAVESIVEAILGGRLTRRAP
jgi:DNA-directed RNA polymerase specialized sigma24 family protein